MNISVVGLGKLGVCMAASFAHRGFKTIGIDLNEKTVDSINRGVAPVAEPLLQQVISESGDSLRASTRHEDAVRDSDVSFVIVPTPTDDTGQFSHRFVRNALRELGQAVKASRKGYHLFVITSTVSPGTTEQNLIPLLESTLGTVVNSGFGICYNPEFVALGSVITDMVSPDVVLIGESDRRSGDILQDIYQRFCSNEPVIARMSLVSAEITKISLNSFVTMKISFANTLASICERIPGADVDAICGAVGSDRRVSHHYLRGGLSFGGPCFPRDNRAFVAFAQQHGCRAPLAEASDAVNTSRSGIVAETVLRYARQGDTVAVLGLAYKPNTSVIEQSPGLQLVQELLERGFRVTAYDPLAMDNVRDSLGEAVQYAESVDQCLANASVCVITTMEREYLSIPQLAARKTVVIDCWRLLENSVFKEPVQYVALGRPMA